jgi:hypothetical protein
MNGGGGINSNPNPEFQNKCGTPLWLCQGCRSASGCLSVCLFVGVLQAGSESVCRVMGLLGMGHRLFVPKLLAVRAVVVVSFYHVNSMFDVLF